MKYDARLLITTNISERIVDAVVAEAQNLEKILPEPQLTACIFLGLSRALFTFVVGAKMPLQALEDHLHEMVAVLKEKEKNSSENKN